MVLVSEPVGGRSRATELPYYYDNHAAYYYDNHAAYYYDNHAAYYYDNQAAYYYDNHAACYYDNLQWHCINLASQCHDYLLSEFLSVFAVYECIS